MDHPKKILIFYASAGHGHEKAARAALEAVREMYPAASAEAVDAISLMPPFFGEGYRQTYLLQIKYVPWLWGIFYYSFDIPWVYSIMRIIRRLMNSAISGGLVKMIEKQNPDVIFSTHFFATEVVSHLKEVGKTRAKLITIVTDYLPHFVWTARCVDRYAVGLGETRDGLVERGVAAEKIEITGIPVEKKFFNPVNVNNVLNGLNLDEGVFTVLLTSGGVGVGSVEPLVEKILSAQKSVQIILVCGSNKTLFTRMNLLLKKYSSLRVLGFVNNMNELMEASDVVVGKAGGLTITESFLKNKPVILLGAIPGQEARNVLCVKAHGAGIEARNFSEAADAVLRLKESADEIKKIKAGIATIARPDAAQKIALLAQSV